MIYTFETLFKTFKLQIKLSFARPMFKYCLLIQPILFSVITYMMFKNSKQDNIISFVILGTGILTLWSCICFSSAGDIERERYMGTLPIIFASPTDFKIIILGKILGNTILGLLPFGISLVVVVIGFKTKFYINNPLEFMQAMFFTLISFIGISLVFAGLFTLSRSARMLMNCIEYPIFILCGLLFPIEVLPIWTRPISYILSPTWAAKVLRMSVEGISDRTLFYMDMMILIFLSVFYYIFSYVLLNIIYTKTRISASLEVS